MDLARYPLSAESLDGLLIRLIEECSEVQKAATKALRFGLMNHHPSHPGESNASALGRELDDLIRAQDAVRSRFIDDHGKSDTTRFPRAD